MGFSNQEDWLAWMTRGDCSGIRTFSVRSHPFHELYHVFSLIECNSLFVCLFSQKENIRLNEVAQKCEQRLFVAEQELDQLRKNLSNCETLLGNYQNDLINQSANHMQTDDRQKTNKVRNSPSRIRFILIMY